MDITWAEYSPEIDPHAYGEVILDKGAKAIHGEKIMSSTDGVITIGLPCAKKWTLTLTSHHIQKFIQNWF